MLFDVIGDHTETFDDILALGAFDARGNAVCHSLIPTFTATGN